MNNVTQKKSSKRYINKRSSLAEVYMEYNNNTYCVRDWIVEFGRYARF